MTERFLEVERLVKRFRGLTATDGANLSIARGELHAVIGPNGAGKTTLVNQIFGEIRSDDGKILLEGVDVTRMPTHRRVKIGLARSYQITSVFSRYTVLDNVALAVQARHGSSFRFWRPVVSESAIFDEARMHLNRVGLIASANTIVGSLGYGEQRQLEIGIALASEPKLVLLDEPLAGMSPNEAERMVSLLEDLKGTVTILLVEHDMSAVFRLADRISTMVYGRVIATGTPNEIREHPDVQRAYLGSSATA
jgi:branched-chain amino acid transport system ATP-binding protein